MIECPIELGTVVVARPGLGREERELGSSSSTVERRGEVMTASTRRGAAGGRGAAVREKWRRSGAGKERTWAGDEVAVVAVHNRGAGLQQVKADGGGWARR